MSTHKSGCPGCKRKPYSKKALTWIKHTEEKEGLVLLNAERGNEFKIPNTRFYADGYCEATNTIYEFHGNAFHGNPRLFHPAATCHPYDSSVTAGELYKRTIDREEAIKRLGFNLVVMWEDEWDNHSTG